VTRPPSPIAGVRVNKQVLTTAATSSLARNYTHRLRAGARATSCGGGPNTSGALADAPAAQSDGDVLRGLGPSTNPSGLAGSEIRARWRTHSNEWCARGWGIARRQPQRGHEPVHALRQHLLGWAASPRPAAAPGSRRSPGGTHGTKARGPAEERRQTGIAKERGERQIDSCGLNESVNVGCKNRRSLRNSFADVCPSRVHTGPDATADPQRARGVRDRRERRSRPQDPHDSLPRRQLDLLQAPRGHEKKKPKR